MGEEYETKILDINVKEIQEKLKKLGAKRIKEVFFRRYIYDINLKNNEWIRLRTDGKETEITYKFKRGKGIADTEEINVSVNDFEKTSKILEKIKCEGIYYQENKRVIYRLGDIEFDIDTWPRIPTYLEIESTSEAKVHEGLRLLGLEGKDIGHPSVKDVYEKYGIDLHKFKELKF